MSTSRGRIPKFASQKPMIPIWWRAANSSSASTRSMLMRAILASVAAPQSQKVQPYGQPRFVSIGRYCRPSIQWSNSPVVYGDG